jgi:hypothetical protein
LRTLVAGVSASGTTGYTLYANSSDSDGAHVYIDNAYTAVFGQNGSTGPGVYGGVAPFLSVPRAAA